MTFTEEQEQLRGAVATLLAKRSDSAAVRKAVESDRGYDADLWQTMCEQIGVAALAVPEEYDGAGAGLEEAFVVLEELGRRLTPSPMLSSVLASQLLLALGDAEANARLLPGIAAGTTIAAVSWAGSDGYVLDGDNADVLLAVTEAGVLEVDPNAPGVTRTRIAAMDPTRRFATVEFDESTAR